MQTNCEFAIGADETGAVVLYVIAEDGNATPVSQQCGTWRRWVEAAAAANVEPGGLLPIEIRGSLTQGTASE